MRPRMISVLASALFVEGLSHEKEAYHSCFLCHRFFSLPNPGSTDAGKGQNFSMGHVSEDHSNTLKV